jgi:hypothetical protein
MDCRTTLTVLAQGVTDVPTSTVDLVYSSSSTPHVYTSSWLKLFATVDDTNCPVTSCKLMDGTCSSTPTANANFYIGANTPWALSAKQNVVDGWVYQTFCIKCLGTKQTGFSKTTPSNLKIRQVRRCSDYMTFASPQTPLTKLLAYSNV